MCDSSRGGPEHGPRGGNPRHHVSKGTKILFFTYIYIYIYIYGIITLTSLEVFLNDTDTSSIFILNIDLPYL